MNIRSMDEGPTADPQISIEEMIIAKAVDLRAMDGGACPFARGKSLPIEKGNSAKDVAIVGDGASDNPCRIQP